MAHARRMHPSIPSQRIALGATLLNINRLNMTRLNTAVRLLALALVVGLAHADCQVQLDQLWSNYTNPAYTFTSCDANCLADCKETLEEAMYETQIEHCPPQSSITSCLQVRTLFPSNTRGKLTMEAPLRVSELMLGYYFCAAGVCLSME